MTTTKAPAFDLLGVQAKTGAWAMAAMALVVAAYWTAMVGMRESRSQAAAPIATAAPTFWEWSYVGHGDDVSTTVHMSDGTYDIHWFGACPATVTLVAWNGTANVTRVSIGTGSVGDAVVALYAGDWYADVISACDWGVRISPT